MEPGWLVLLIIVGLLSGMGYCLWAWKYNRTLINKEEEEEENNNFLSWGRPVNDNYSLI
jgi:hypothetical protein